MKRVDLRRCAAGCLGALALDMATSAPGQAQTWQWTYMTQTPNAPALHARSTVTIDGGQLRMLYTVPIAQRQVVIESCHAALNDLAGASTVHTQGRMFLLVQMKPPRSAFCETGTRPAVALPTESEHNVGPVIAAINQSCCTRTAAIVHVAAAPRPAPSATPVAVAVALRVRDWVERSGRYSFVRVENAGGDAVRVRDTAVSDCRDVAFGCGPAGREVVLDPHAAATVAVVASEDQRRKPGFHYRYTVAHGALNLSRDGSSASAAPRGAGRMTAQQVRSAAADVPDTAPSPEPAPESFTPPRLLKRGSSRLAIGITGTAMVRLMIAENGTPLEATIVTVSDRRLTAAAIETAVSTTFAPALQNGKPVAAKYVATYTFDGEDPALASIPVWKRSPVPLSSPAAPAPTDVSPPVQASPLPQAMPSP